MAIALGEAGAKRLHHLYIAGAYAVTLVLVGFSLFSPWTLIVFASVPAALKLSRAVQTLGAPDIDPHDRRQNRPLPRPLRHAADPRLLIGIIVAPEQEG